VNVLLFAAVERRAKPGNLGLEVEFGRPVELIL